MKQDFAITIMLAHQGGHSWVAAFDEGASDASVYLSWGEDDAERFTLTAPTLGFFFWDLAQTGLAWKQCNEG